MASTASARPAPWHLWVVGVLGLIWNSFGCYDYTMTHLDPVGYMQAAGMSAQDIAYMAALPGWLTIFWALGVWGSLAGSILLLLRSRHAVTAFLVSLAGFVVTQAWQLTFTIIPADMRTPGMWAMTAAIAAGLVFFLWYARSARDAGLLD